MAVLALIESLSQHDEQADTRSADGLNSKAKDVDREHAIQAVQVSQTVRAIPFFLIFHAAAALSLYSFVHYPKAPIMLPLWYGTAIAVGFGFAAIFFLWLKTSWQQKPQAILRGLELLCLVLAIVWALPLAAAIEVGSASNTIAVACIVLAMMAVTTMSFIRIPTGIVVFLSLVSSTLAGAFFQSIESQQMVAIFLCVIFCLVLLSITLASHLDFRRRTHAELDVQRQKQVIQLLLSDFERGSADWFWETDVEGRLTYSSQRLAQCLGLSQGAILGKRLRHVLADVAPLEDLRKLDLALDEALTLNDFPLTVQVNGKDMQWSFTAQPIESSKGRKIGHRGVCRDLTIDHDNQQRLEKAMQESAKVAATKSQFLAVMSHELRTPINAIVGFSQMLAKGSTAHASEKTRQEFAATILENAQQLQTLINEILDAASLDRGTLNLQVQDVDAAETIEIAIKLCRQDAEIAGVSLIGQLIDDVTISVDVARFKQAINNLLLNAIKFSSKGSIVHIEMQRGPDGKLMVTIKDAGIGIAPADLSRVFEPFVQVDASLARKYGGVGLGLSIARHIARLHDGDITLDSTPGAGTTAKLILPKRRVYWAAQSGKQLQDVA